MNYVYISPNYPVTATFFCERLHADGVTVLGIGDAPYDSLDPRLKEALTEYYRVSSLADYDQVFRAVAFFSYKYGKIDWLESMNEFWLETDAKLRTDFNIPVGTRTDRIAFIKEKALMKEVYANAGIPTARQHIVSTREAGRAFVGQAGFPVIVKPNVGVGANDTWKLSDWAGFESFYDSLPQIPYVMEEFIEGDIWTYDAVLDSRCEPLFESTMTYAPVMDAVVNDLDVCFYTSPDVPPQLAELGRRTVKAFGADRRFVHLEFFRLAKARPGLGEEGDFVALEVNMRPAGGHDPDMMNFAHSVDVFKIYADMVTSDRRVFPAADAQYFCAYAARKDGHVYSHSHDEVMGRFSGAVVLYEEMPPIDWPQMGRYVYIAKFRTFEEVKEYFEYILEGAG